MTGGRRGSDERNLFFGVVSHTVFVQCSSQRNSYHRMKQCYCYRHMNLLQLETHYKQQGRKYGMQLPTQHMRENVYYTMQSACYSDIRYSCRPSHPPPLHNQWAITPTNQCSNSKLLSLNACAILWACIAWRMHLLDTNQHPPLLILLFPIAIHKAL